MPERRRDLRRRSYLGGQIAFKDRFSTLNCLVRNLSDGGAKLSFAHPPLIPSEFDLKIVKKGDFRRVQIVWQADLETGVTFQDWDTIPDVDAAGNTEPTVDPVCERASDPVIGDSGRSCVVISLAQARKKFRRVAPKADFDDQD